MDISIIICTYNRAQLLKRTLESIGGLVVPPGLAWEVLVVDNNSSDTTKDVVADFARAGRIPVRYVSESKQGKSIALNTGIRQSRGDVVAFVDDDMTFDEGYLQSVAEAANKYPQATGFGGRILINWPIPKPDWIIMDGPYRNIDGTIGHRDFGDINKDFSELNSLPSGGNMFFRRNLFTAGNYFREDIGPLSNRMSYGEDMEFCQRLLSSGSRLCYIAGAIVYHNIPKEKISKRYFCQRRHDSARDSVMFTKEASDTACVFGVPRYLFAYLISSFIKWVFCIGSARRFYYKLKVCSILGQIAGYQATR
jgi:glycosyltransferase involved in cell wall biosynthesis